MALDSRYAGSHYTPEREQDPAEVQRNDLAALRTLMKANGELGGATVLLDTMRHRYGPEALRMTGKDGLNVLQVGLMSGADVARLTMLLEMDPGLATLETPEGQSTIQLANNYHSSPAVWEALLTVAPSLASVYSDNFRLPLHCALDRGYAAIAAKLVSLYPEAASVKDIDGDLPLTMAISQDLPHSLSLRILSAYRSAAAFRDQQGNYPLHIAIAKQADVRLINALMDAYPGCLLKPMDSVQGARLPVECAVAQRHAPMVLQRLLDTKENNNPRALAYAQASATCRLTRTFDRKSPHLQPSVTYQLRLATPKVVGQTSSVRIHVQPTTGGRVTMEADMNGKIDGIRYYFGLTTIPPHLTSVVMQGRELASDKSLWEAGVKTDSTLVLKSSFELLNSAIKAGVDVKTMYRIMALRPEAALEDDSYGSSPLVNALLSEAPLEVLEKMIAEDPLGLRKQFVIAGSDHMYPLLVALEQKASPAAIALLLRGSQPYDWTSDGIYNPAHHPVDFLVHVKHQPLFIALENGNVEVLQLLIENGCPLAARCRRNGLSLIEAAACGGIDVFEYVFDTLDQHSAEASAEANPGSGRFPLHSAVSDGADMKVIDRLLEAHPGAIEHADFEGMLPLHLAVGHGAPLEVVRKLTLDFRKGALATINARTRQGRSVLQIAVTSKPPAGVVAHILAKDPRMLHAVDGHGRSLLEAAVRCDAPSHVLTELLSVDPTQVEQINLFDREWPNNRASAEVVQIARQQRQHPVVYPGQAAIADVCSPEQSTGRTTGRESQDAEEASPSITSFIGSLSSWFG
eukprot:TRINITY_DN38186_c0_g1_i1.p1 TRINITY_DN38186_c0_g1~~TRINITY_DN38186_c0_g1_i1.p1  ORF type:complete len:802 (+),score=70.98 TRINITY_DN38186_c0_g1_i1:68-2473(+)